MTTRIRAALAIPLLLLLALPLPAAAQDLEATATHLDIDELDGVEIAISRSYATDVEDIIEAVEDREEAEEDNGSTGNIDDGIRDGPLTMLALVAEFDTPDNAADAYDTLQDRLQQQLESYSGTDADVAGLPDLGENATQVSTSRDTGISVIQVSGVLVQDDEWIHLAIAVSADDTAPDAAHELVDYGLGQSPGSEEVIYLHTGGSQGGHWAMLPGEENTSGLNGTMPIYDNQLVPANSGE